MKIKQLTILSLCLSSLFLAACATTNNIQPVNGDEFFNQAVEAYQNGNSALAVQLFEKACNADIVPSAAYFNLGMLYFSGDGVEKNYQKSAQLFEKACEAGMADGCYNLAEQYLRAEGVERNVTTAEKYFKKSCEKGNQDACDLAK